MNVTFRRKRGFYIVNQFKDKPVVFGRFFKRKDEIDFRNPFFGFRIKIKIMVVLKIYLDVERKFFSFRGNQIVFRAVKVIFY